MPHKTKKKKPKMYNSEDCYNLEEVQEDAKKVKAKDVFEGYKPPSKNVKKGKTS